MTGPFSPKVMAPGEGTTVKLFGVRFNYKIVSADSDGALAVMEVEIPAGWKAISRSSLLSSLSTARRLSTTSWPTTTAS